MQIDNGTNIVSPPSSHTSRELGPVAAAVAVHCNVHPAVTRNSVVSRRPIAGDRRAGVDFDSPSSPVSPLTDSVVSDKREPSNERLSVLVGSKVHPRITRGTTARARAANE